MASRKSSPVGQLVGLMILSVLALALTGLFGIWYLHQESHKALAELGDLTRLIDSTRKTQVEFKTQVQLWKNLLLRGQNAEDFADYEKRFAQQNDLVQKNLTEVLDSKSLPGEFRAEVEGIAGAHRELFAKYEAALAQYSQTDPTSLFRVDAAVRGIDQPVNTRIDKLSEEMVALEAKRFAETTTQAEGLYRALQIVAGVVSFVALLCAGLLAWRCLQAKN